MILVSGEGRSGSTFFLHFLGELGFDIGGHDEFLREVNLDDTIQFPEAIKHLGGFSTNLDHWLDRYEWHVDHFYFVTCGVDLAVTKRLKYGIGNPAGFVGTTDGRWRVMSEIAKRKDLTKRMYEIMAKALDTTLRRGIPFTAVSYPRFCLDGDYARRILEPILHLKGLDTDKVMEVHSRFVELDKLHEYKEYGK